MRLETIAHDMIQQAQRQGKAVRDLPRGLRIEYCHFAGTRVLALSRPLVPPGDDEISICRYAFGVPLDAGRENGDRAVTLRWEVA